MFEFGASHNKACGNKDQDFSTEVCQSKRGTGQRQGCSPEPCLNVNLGLRSKNHFEGLVLGCMAESFIGVHDFVQ